MYVSPWSRTQKHMFPSYRLAEVLGGKEASCKNPIKTIDFLTYLVKKYKFYLKTESLELFIF